MANSASVEDIGLRSLKLRTHDQSLSADSERIACADAIPKPVKSQQTADQPDLLCAD